MGSTSLVVTGTTVGAITLNLVVLGIISGSEVILKTFSGIKTYSQIIAMARFAYTNYKKVRWLSHLGWLHLRYALT